VARESAASVALTGGPRSPAVAWLALPVVTLAARFNARGVSVGVAIAATLIVVSTFGVNPTFAAAHPQDLAFPLALLIGLALLSMALMRTVMRSATPSCAVAYKLRKCLRAFDLAYRLGGEEFLVILPGGDADQSAGVAEDLRRAIGAEAAAGVRVTMSFGVSASEPGSFDYERTFAAAGLALYEARNTGRNRVCVAGAGARQFAALAIAAG